MDLLAGAGSAAGVAAFVVAVWQLRVAITERRDRRRQESSPPSLPDLEGVLPVTAPLGRLPAEVLGRDDLIAELSAASKPHRKAPPGTWVLAGLGGVGKSTIALRLAAEAGRRGSVVWWVNAGDPVSLRGGLLEVLRQTGAPEEVVREVGDGRPTGPDRFWRFLDERRTSRHELLIFDNADLPAVLSADGQAPPGDGTGWIRPDACVFTLVTTRSTDPRTWGEGARVRRLAALPDEHAAAVLRGLAPDVPDPDGRGALALARRLGGLPLALHLAGSYLASPFARWHDFQEYSSALDHAEDAFAELIHEGSGQIALTWELSLDALASQGIGEAREFLYGLAGFDPLAPLPQRLLPGDEPHRRATVLRALADVALIDVAPGAGFPSVTLHPVVADTCRARLRADGPYEIVEEAVDRLVTATGALDRENAADWPAWERLIPHVRALLDWSAPLLAEPALIALLDAASAAFGSLWLADDRLGTGANDLAQAMERAAARLDADHPSRLLARHHTGIVLWKTGDHAAAETLLNEVLDGLVAALGSRHRDVLAVRDTLIEVYLAQRRFPEAERAYRALLVDQTCALGAEDPDTLATQVDLAWSIGMQDRFSEAVEICASVLAVDRRVLGPEHPRTLDAWSDLARWTLARGLVAEAADHARELTAVADRVLGTDHPLSLVIRTILARALAAQGRSAEADAIFSQTLAKLDATVGRLDYRTILARHDYAAALAAQGRVDEAAHFHQDL